MNNIKPIKNHSKFYSQNEATNDMMKAKMSSKQITNQSIILIDDISDSDSIPNEPKSNPKQQKNGVILTIDDSDTDNDMKLDQDSKRIKTQNNNVNEIAVLGSSTNTIDIVDLD